MPTTPNDLVRIRRAIEEMYRCPWARPALLIEGIAVELGCGRRQLERAFASLGLSAADELRAIRCELAAACLVAPTWREITELRIARRLGLADDRALRRLFRDRWGVSPGAIRSAAELQRYLVAMGGIVGPACVRELRKSIRGMVSEAPIEVHRLVEGDGVFPLPRQAVRQRRELAKRRVSEYDEPDLASLELAA